MSDEIWIVTDDVLDAPIDGSKGWGDEVQRGVLSPKGVRISVAELEQKMADFLQVVGRLFRQAERQALQEQQAGLRSGMRLDEVELSVEISAGGEIKLIAGGKAEGKGAIKLKFKRVEP